MNIEETLDRIVSKIWNDSDVEFITLFNRGVTGWLLSPNKFILHDEVITSGEEDLDEGRAEGVIEFRLKRKLRMAVLDGRFPEYSDGELT